MSELGTFPEIRSAGILAALHIDPWRYLTTEDDIERMAGQAIAEQANDFLNKRDSALAKATAQEIGRVLSKMFKKKK